MTETGLITAEELLEKLAQLTAEDTSEAAIIFGDLVSQEARRTMCLEAIRAFHRNATLHWLERAAKAVCPFCDMGDPFEPMPAHLHDEMPMFHAGANHLSCRRRCEAQRIWQLIPKDPAPAGEVKPWRPN